MTSNVTLFNNASFGNVRVIADDMFKPLFCLKDVATILNINNPKVSRFNLSDRGVHKMYLPTKSGNQEITFIDEPNLYRLIFRSNKREAIAFQNWVFEEVLPTIRKQGFYSAAQAPAPQQLENKRKLDLPNAEFREVLESSISKLEEKNNCTFVELIEYDVRQTFKNGKVETYKKVSFTSRSKD